MLLRLAIGWHFLYEGVSKVYSTPEGRQSFLAKILPPPAGPPPMEKGETAFSAETYLRNSTGPFATYFRGLVPDIDSTARLDLDSIKTEWTEDLDLFASHYHFDADKRKAAEAALQAQLDEADLWFKNPENAQKVQKYRDDLEHVTHVLNDPRTLDSAMTQAYRDRAALEKDRQQLVGVVEGWTAALEKKWIDMVPADQRPASEPQDPWDRIDYINAATKWGLTAVGLLLMVGLFTRLAALGAAGYLLMFYLSMPPWPGLPAGPMAEGHYLFVNKNLIEMLACLALASLPTGYWVGLDALFFGWLRRRRLARAAEIDQPSLFDDDPSGPANTRTSRTFSRSDR